MDRTTKSWTFAGTWLLFFIVTTASGSECIKEGAKRDKYASLFHGELSRLPHPPEDVLRRNRTNHLRDEPNGISRRAEARKPFVEENHGAGTRKSQNRRMKTRVKRLAEFDDRRPRGGRQRMSGGNSTSYWKRESDLTRGREDSSEGRRWEKRKERGRLEIDGGKEDGSKVERKNQRRRRKRQEWKRRSIQEVDQQPPFLPRQTIQRPRSIQRATRPSEHGDERNQSRFDQSRRNQSQPRNESPRDARERNPSPVDPRQRNEITAEDLKSVEANRLKPQVHVKLEASKKEKPGELARELESYGAKLEEKEEPSKSAGFPWWATLLIVLLVVAIFVAMVALIVFAARRKKEATSSRPKAKGGVTALIRSTRDPTELKSLSAGYIDEIGSMKEEEEEENKLKGIHSSNFPSLKEAKKMARKSKTTVGKVLNWD